MIIERIEGKCKCGRSVTRLKIEGERTFRRNKMRYIYPEKPDDGYDIFRCESCMEVIENNWAAVA